MKKNHKYKMSIVTFEPYKQVWINNYINLGVCKRKNDAINRAYLQLAERGRHGWKNLIIQNENNEIIYIRKNENEKP